MKEKLYRKTPVMGWASWNCFRTDINEERMKEQIDALVSTGLSECGYIYANMDDGFYGGRAADGTLLIHKKRFPNGVKLLADYAHEKGLKAGIYAEGGDRTCGFYYDQEGENGVNAGLYGHETQDLNLFLDKWGFDFIKVDWCGGIRLGLDEETQYGKIGQIIDEIRSRTGKCIVYNVCRWQFPGSWVTEIADSWRTGADINPNFESILYQIDSIKPLARYCSPGHVNDLDMMQIGNGMSTVEEKTHFTMWCMMSTPLILGCDLTKISKESLEIVKNREMIAVNQDAACLQAYPIKEFFGKDGTLAGEIWIKDLGRKISNKKAVVFLNRSQEPLHVEFNWEEAGLAGEILEIRDLWSHKRLACSLKIAVTLGPKEVMAYKVLAEAAVPVANPWDVGEVAADTVKKIDPEEVGSLLEAGAVLVDVREPEKYRAGHLKNAVNLPYYDLHAMAGHYIQDKTIPVIVYCSAGKRSMQAQKSLQYMGYKNVYYLGGLGALSGSDLRNLLSDQ